MLDGFTITDGNANAYGTSLYNAGGGIYNLGTLKVVNVIVISNSAIDGGGIYVSGFNRCGQ